MLRQPVADLPDTPALGRDRLVGMQRKDPMIKAVTYDLDGTLIDSTDAIVLCFNHACDVLELKRPAREDIVRTIGHILEDQFRMLTTGDPEVCVAEYRKHYATVCRDM